MRRAVEKGQAFSEFVVCLIPLVFVFAGFLLVAVLGRANVLCTLGARSKADVLSAKRLFTGGEKAQNIICWDRGSDGIPFTADDSPVTGGASGMLYDAFDSTSYTVRSYSASMTLEDLRKAGYVSMNPAGLDFTAAAGLNGIRLTAEDVLSDSQLAMFSRMFRLYLNSGVVNVSDAAFMPASK